MDVLRTPDECFDGLPEFDYTPCYTEIEAESGEKLRIHHLDEGPRDGEIVLCMHGQPTWCYLYRKMLPLLTAAGYRVIAPDLVGFGRSDKPAAQSDYTYARHVQWMSAWLEALNLRDATLVCQDWGGLIGLRLVAAYPERFARVVVGNTGLPDAEGLDASMAGPMRELLASVPVVTVDELPARFLDSGGAPGFFYWIRFAAEQPDFRVGELMRVTAGCDDPSILAAYDAPFPGPEFMAGARRFPGLVPLFPDDPELPAQRAAWDALRRFDKPFLTAFSDGDPVTAGGHERFQREVPGAEKQQHVTIRGGGHFLQEDQPEALATAVIAFIRANPL